MPKKDFGNIVGTCDICNINLWDSTNGKPAIWPCNLEGCLYEDSQSQHLHHNERDFSWTGCGLGQIDF